MEVKKEQVKEATKEVAKEEKKEHEKEDKEDKKEETLAGGHISNFKFNSDGTLLKKTVDAEVKFLQEINDKACKYYAEREAINKFLPKFVGVEVIDGAKWVKMENVNFGLTHPSYIDVKMGTQTYAPDYPEEKKKRHQEADKKTTTPTHGLKISGMVIKDKDGNTTHKLYKSEVKADELPKTFRYLLTSGGATKPNEEALNHYIKVCQEVLEFFESVGKRYFVASSLFFVISNTDNKFALKLIDFAHVKPIEDMGLTRDEGIIFGLKNMIKILIKSSK